MIGSEDIQALLTVTLSADSRANLAAVLIGGSYRVPTLAVEL